MKQKSNLTILLSAIIMMFSLICGTALAKQAPPPPPEPVCGGLTGTWHGIEPGDMAWLAIHTSDSLDPAKGEMLMNWIWVNPSLIGGDGNSLTPGHGVWQLNSAGMYDFTWYAFVIDPYGITVGAVRVSGVAFFNEELDPTMPIVCDIVHIDYNFALLIPADPDTRYLDLDPANFITVIPNGAAGQKRVPMVVTP